MKNLTRTTQSPINIVLMVTLMTLPMHTMAHHVSVGGPANDSGPINTITPQTLGKGKYAFNLSVQPIEYDSFSNETLENFALAGIEEIHSTDDATVWSAAFEYGVTDRFDLSIQVPLVQRSGIREGELEDDGVAEVHVLGDVRGLGDISLLARYRLLDGTEQGGIGLAVIGGVQLPTGSTDETQNSGERFEQEFQPGSGATNALLGVSAGRNIGPVGVYGSLLYTFTNEGSQDTDLGDVFSYNLGIAYRLGRGAHVHDDGTFERHRAIDLVLEVNGEWQDSEVIGPEQNRHSGGRQLFVSPGVRYSSKQGWIGALSILIPVDEDLNGIQNDTDTRVVASFGFGF